MIKFTKEQIDTIADYIFNSKKIDAIKVVRDILGCDLLIAKNIIDEYPCPRESALLRTREQSNLARESSDRFRDDMKCRQFYNFKNMRETMNALIGMYGTKVLLKHIVAIMDDDTPKD